MRDLSRDEVDALSEALSSVYRRARGRLRMAAGQARVVLDAGTWKTDDNDLLQLAAIAHLGRQEVRLRSAVQQARIEAVCERVEGWRSEVVADIEANGLLLTTESGA